MKKMKVNKFTPGNVVLTYQSDKANKSVRAKTPPPKRAKAPNEALSQHDDFHWRKRPEYKTGDMDHTTYVPREGSCHKHLKSFGDGT